MDGGGEEGRSWEGREADSGSEREGERENFEEAGADALLAPI